MGKGEKVKASKCIIDDLKFIELDNQKDENFEEIYEDLKRDISQLNRISKLKFSKEGRNVKR